MIDGKNKTSDLLYYLFQASPHLKAEEVIDQVQATLNDEDGKKVIMTVAEQLRQKGIEEGLKQGIEQGIEQGEILLISKQLQKKFGQAAKPYQTVLASLSLDQLDIIAERLITESSLEAIFDGLPSKLS